MKANDPRHGTYNGYHNLGCRCKRCRSANAAWHRDYRHRTGRSRTRVEYLVELRSAPPPAHGTESRYCGYRCRCDECRDAASAARRRRRAAA